MTSMKRLIEKHPVLVYYLLAFTLSWGGLLLVMGPEGLLGFRAPSESQLPLLYVAILSGPAAAGLLMNGIRYGRAGLRDLLSRLRHLRVGARWYAVALLTAPLSMMATLLLLSQLSPALLPSIMTTEDRGSLLLTAVAGGLSAGILEELGWTGFAVPELRRRRGVLATGLIAGLLWGAWHYPLFAAAGRSAGSISPVLYLSVLLFSVLPAFRVLMVWVYERTRSLTVNMLMHVSLTASTLLLQPLATGALALTYNLALATALWLCIAALTLANRGQLSSRPLHSRPA